MRIVHDGARQALDDMNNGRYWPQIFKKNCLYSAKTIMEKDSLKEAERCMNEIGVRYEA